MDFLLKNNGIVYLDVQIDIFKVLMLCFFYKKKMIVYFYFLINSGQLFVYINYGYYYILQKVKNEIVM